MDIQGLLGNDPSETCLPGAPLHSHSVVPRSVPRQLLPGQRFSFGARVSIVNAQTVPLGVIVLRMSSGRFSVSSTTWSLERSPSMAAEANRRLRTSGVVGGEAATTCSRLRRRQSIPGDRVRESGTGGRCCTVVDEHDESESRLAGGRRVRRTGRREPARPRVQRS